MGCPVSEPVGDARRRRHVQQHLVARTPTRSPGSTSPTRRRPGTSIELSVEHHLFSEIKLDRVENWDFNAPQTEEEAQTSPEAVAFEINASRNITIANYHAYRVTRNHQPFAAAVRIDQLLRHPFPQRARQVGERLCRVRRERLRPLPACRQVPVRERRCRTSRTTSRCANANSPCSTSRPRRPRRRRAPPPSLSASPVQEARGRLLHDLRRDRRCRRHAVLRRSPSAADLLVVGEPRPGHRARCAARSREPRRRQVRDICSSCRLPDRKARCYAFNPGEAGRRAHRARSRSRRRRARTRRRSCRSTCGSTASSRTSSISTPTST